MVNSNLFVNHYNLDQLKQDITVYEELLNDVMNVLSSVMSFGVHSGESIDRLLKRIGCDSVESKRNNFSSLNEFIHKKKMNRNVSSSYNSDCDSLDANECDTKRNSKDDGDEMDSIRFTNTGPIFEISKNILDSYEGSYISEQRSEDYRTSDGTIFLGYEGNDASVYYLLDFLNNKKVDFDKCKYEEQLEILDLFEFCNLPLPVTLVNCRERRDLKKKKYEEGNKITLFVNNKKDTIIRDYLVKNGFWDNYIKNYDNGFVNYNPVDDSLYMNKKYEYIEYIYEYIKNGTIDVETEKINDIHKELLENEMYDLFGYKGKKQVKEGMIPFKFFRGTTVLKNKIMEKWLIDLIGKGNRWKLLFRASEHEYKASEFHKYCDNKGETVTIIKHIGHDHLLNIFGGYTTRSWDVSESYKPYSNEFIFTLSNEHGIPPTKYDYTSKDTSCGIGCYSSYGPQFGLDDIYISDDCHNNDLSYCDASCYSEIDSKPQSSLFVNTDSSDLENYFIVEDYEVWTRF
ncbi:hypothetical protein WA158_007839 [Blastocystis sp. Blastoise]